jgi:hypothetical protein
MLLLVVFIFENPYESHTETDKVRVPAKASHPPRRSMLWFSSPQPGSSNEHLIKLAGQMETRKCVTHPAPATRV